MAWREHTSSFLYYVAIPPQALTVAAAGAGTNDISGLSINLKGYDSLTLVAQMGAQASASGASYYRLAMLHADESSASGTASTFSACLSTDMIRWSMFGWSIGASYASGVAVSSGVWLSVDGTAWSGITACVAYRGSRQFVRCDIMVGASAFSGGNLISVVGILGHAANWPVNAPVTQ